MSYEMSNASTIGDAVYGKGVTDSYVKAQQWADYAAVRHGADYAGQWPLTSPEWVVCANAAYVVLVVAGRAVMSSPKIPAFELKLYRQVYNLSCILLSTVSLCLIVRAAVTELGPRYVCNPSASMHPSTVYAVYIFYLSKFWEYQDTAIMVLRKKFNQVSFLHVYHHSSISIVVWSYLRFTGGGDEYLAVGLNSFVHVLLYSHYLATSFGIAAPWRSSLTSLQLAQFILILVQAVLGLLLNCGWPDFLNLLQITYMGTMLLLFGNFFVQQYIRPKSKKV